MPILIKPGSDEDRLRFLETAELEDGHDTALNNPRLSAATKALMAARKAAFASAFSGMAMRLGARVKEVTEAQRADSKLEVYVRDYIEVLKRRTYRLEHNISVLTHHSLPQDGSVPAINSRADLVTVATNLISGDGTAVGAGFPAMANPSAAEVNAKFGAAQTERSQVGPADEALDQAQNIIAAQRAGIDELIDDVIADIQYKERKQDITSIRRILRRYGAKYEFTEGETPDPEPTPTPTPTPPPA